MSCEISPDAFFDTWEHAFYAPGRAIKRGTFYVSPFEDPFAVVYVTFSGACAIISPRHDEDSPEYLETFRGGVLTDPHYLKMTRPHLLQVAADFEALEQECSA